MYWTAEPNAAAPDITSPSRISCQTSGAFSAWAPLSTAAPQRVVLLPQQALPSLALRAQPVSVGVLFALALVQLLSFSPLPLLPAFPRGPLPYPPIRGTPSGRSRSYDTQAL